MIERFIAFRYFFSPKSDGFISLISFLSFLGILLGVSALIIVTSIMNGFRQELMNQLVGVTGHVHIYPTQPINLGKIMDDLSEDPHVLLALPTVEQPTIMVHNERFNGIMVHAHDIAQLSKHVYFTKSIQKGNIDDLQQNDTIFIGSRLASQFGLNLGDEITLIYPTQDMFGPNTKERSFKIVGIFEFGMREYDKRFIYMSLENAASFFETGASHIEVFTNPPQGVAKEIEERLNNESLHIVDFEHTNSSLFQTLRVEKNVMFIVLSLMVLIAVLNIVSSLIMLVKDKVRDIAILRTMGMTCSSVAHIFLLDGMIIGVIGTLGGLILGIVFVYNIEAIRVFIEALFGTKLFNSEVYYLNQLPAILDWFDITMICALSLFSSFVATLYPALRAARLDPVAILR